MSFKTFSFQKQLKSGELGEQHFIKCYHKLNPRKSSAREVDIFINENDTVELKTDSYNPEKTPNFFIELIGSSKTGKLGGAHLAKINSITYFVYHYPMDGSFYWFRPKDLADFIDENFNKYQKREIRNYGWTSTGILLPREEVEHLLIKKDTFPL